MYNHHTYAQITSLNRKLANDFYQKQYSSSIGQYSSIIHTPFQQGPTDLWNSSVPAYVLTFPASAGGWNFCSNMPTKTEITAAKSSLLCCWRMKHLRCLSNTYSNTWWSDASWVTWLQMILAMHLNTGSCIKTDQKALNITCQTDNLIIKFINYYFVLFTYYLSGVSFICVCKWTLHILLRTQ